SGLPMRAIFSSTLSPSSRQGSQTPVSALTFSLPKASVNWAKALCGVLLLTISFPVAVPIRSSQATIARPGIAMGRAQLRGERARPERSRSVLRDVEDLAGRVLL